MSAALQPFFTKVDEVVTDLEEAANPKSASTADEDLLTETVDLLRRAAFVLGNMINAHNQLAVHLVLPEEKPAAEPADENYEGPRRPEDFKFDPKRPRKAGDKPLTSVAEVAEVLGVDTDSDSHDKS